MDITGIYEVPIWSDTIKVDEDVSDCHDEVLDLQSATNIARWRVRLLCRIDAQEAVRPLVIDGRRDAQPEGSVESAQKVPRLCRIVANKGRPESAGVTSAKGSKPRLGAFCH